MVILSSRLIAGSNSDVDDDILLKSSVSPG
jgi:hypothetical protein